MTIEQILVPQQCCQQVMHIAHTIPLAGHLGHNKTARRLMQRFYWPTLFRDVANYCWWCAECQKSSGERVQWSTMIPHPMMGVPFKKIAMDIVGPLPRSQAGHRYILVVCDYTTRFPKAFPLTRIDAPQTAEELIPHQDCWQRSTNYYMYTQYIPPLTIHRRMDLWRGLTRPWRCSSERQVCETGKDWDKLLLYLLFAYQEVPQASTRFSPLDQQKQQQTSFDLSPICPQWYR